MFETMTYWKIRVAHAIPRSSIKQGRMCLLIPIANPTSPILGVFGLKAEFVLFDTRNEAQQDQQTRHNHCPQLDVQHIVVETRVRCQSYDHEEENQKNITRRSG